MCGHASQSSLYQTDMCKDILAKAVYIRLIWLRTFWLMQPESDITVVTASPCITSDKLFKLFILNKQTCLVFSQASVITMFNLMISNQLLVAAHCLLRF